ncbi:hypothetical protein BIY29_11835 [Brenneria alni]|uniref:DNA helicase n=1 Tax=Brenneria alni TaxID=71656 RepID=A0A421DMU6_9GAMM|nr:AAA domain-containing protein [Brenneria alni]RLM22674.1 hypothetical protein BIY29_11835 [Brenneria alni]
MSQYFRQISRYFRQSLIDADRLCPDDKDILPVIGPDKTQDPTADYLALSQQVWERGGIEISLAEQILEARQPRNKPPLQQMEIVIFPRVDLLVYQGGAIDKRKREVCLPLVAFVNLQRDGTLLPGKKAPWIPRVWIGPTQGATQPFTEMSLLDEFFTLHPFEGINSWPQLKSYCTRLLCHATGTPFIDASADNPAIAISDIEVDNEYQQSEQCLLQFNTPIVGAKANLLKALDFLIERNCYPTLYQAYSRREAAPLKGYQEQKEATDLAKQHLGQMSGEFPLSSKQRNALHYFIQQQAGEILAVNGPPGTGKTTLLRSVVANLWTKAALEKKEPPLIVAASNNNQAVTNILESFARIDEAGMETSLQGRWLPEVDSYGLYFCARERANDKNLYRYSGPKGEGCMQGWQTSAFVTQALEHFLAKVSAWQQKACKDLDESLDLLHQAMLHNRQKIHHGIEYLSAWQAALKQIERQYGSLEELKDVLAKTERAMAECAKQYGDEKSLLDTIYKLWESRSWWVRLLIWLPPIRKQEARRTARLLNKSDRHLPSTMDDAVEADCNQRLATLRDESGRLEKTLAGLQSCLSQFDALQEKLDTWMQPASALKLFSQSRAEQVAELNDRYYRFRLFKLATHYFEAHWLKETKLFVDSHDEDKKTPLKLLRKLRRYAKLTPCFVSTFYMAPSAFMAGEFRDKVWTDLPQLEEVDLLIVDEAGQALPDVSAVSFALAKRALIVGDTDQIEPVWNIPASVDRSNLALFELLKGETDYEQWLHSGLLASSGNVMQLAQRQCHYHQFEQLPRGLYLTEHRRCFNNIVGYCNELVYKGILEPLRGNARHAIPWGMMTLQPVLSPSRTFGGSRGNPGEAQVIAQWLLSESSAIVQYARQQDKKYLSINAADVLQKTVGIVTPFSKQSELIRRALREVGIEGITVGTVHSLQGDERLIVLFSSVYGENDKSSGKFYDCGPNMLNVAVSRAKDAFIVFGDPNVFGVGASGTPSGMLRARLAVTEDKYSTA